MSAAWRSRAGRLAGALARERHLQVVAAVTVAAGILRFATLDLQGFADGEPATLKVVAHPGFLDMLGQMAATERSGPLYYVLAWMWTKPLGTGEAGIRSLSALIGTLTVPVAYLAAAELASRRAGLIAAVLVGANPYLLWFSHEARSYALLVLLVGLGLLFLARATRLPGRRSLLLWALASAAAMATHYFAIFFVGPAALWLLYVRRDKVAVGAVALAGAAGLALLPLALHQSEGHRDTFANVPVAKRLVVTGIRFSGGERSGMTTELWGLRRGSLALGVASAGLGLIGLLLLAHRGLPAERRGGFLAAGLGLLTVAFPLALVLGGLDLLKPKNMVGALLPLLVAAAAGFGARGVGRLGTAAAAAMGALFAVGSLSVLTDSDLKRQDWRGLADAIGPASDPRLIVTPLNSIGKLGVYLEDAEKARSHVAQVDRDQVLTDEASAAEIVVVTARKPARPARGFELAGRDSAADLDVYHYRTGEPRRVAVADLDGERLVGPRFGVLAQEGADDRLGRESPSARTGSPRHAGR